MRCHVLYILTVDYVMYKVEVESRKKNVQCRVVECVLYSWRKNKLLEPKDRCWIPGTHHSGSCEWRWEVGGWLSLR